MSKLEVMRSLSERGVELKEDQLERIEAYVALLLKWNKVHNLIGRSTESDIWSRHVLDSLQLLKYLPKSAEPLRVADLGTGAGIPGVILACCDVGRIDLVESNAKKCSFLLEAKRVCDVDVHVHNSRIEALESEEHYGQYDVVTSRALADLEMLFSYAKPLLKENGLCVFLKGRQAGEEVKNAEQNWEFMLNTYPTIVESQKKTEYKEKQLSTNDGVIAIVSSLKQRA